MRAFICNVVPNNLIVKLKAPQAPNNFCFNLIENNIFDKTISLIPPSYYDDNIKDDSFITYMYGNKKSNKFLKNIQAIFNAIKAAWILRKFDSIWFYNICISNIITYIILRFIYKAKVYVILLDYTPSNNKFSIIHYIPWLYKKANGVISLSERTKINNNNLLYKAGVMSKSKIKPVKTYSTNKKLNYLFSGNLDNHTGFPLALEVFKELPELDLYVTGNGKVDIKDIEKYPNIHFLGYLDYREYLNIYTKVDVCLSFRNPNYEENNNNFPSKILEYFAYGKIVLSTINYPELNGFNYIKSSYSKEAIKECINNLSNANINELNKLCDNKRAILTNFSEDSWLLAINKIEQI